MYIPEDILTRSVLFTHQKLQTINLDNWSLYVFPKHKEKNDENKWYFCT